MLNFPTPPQGQATASGDPAGAGAPAPVATYAASVRAQLRTLAHAMSTAVGRLTRAPIASLDATTRRSLLDRYASLHDEVEALEQRLIKLAEMPDAAEAVGADASRLQTDAHEFVQAVDREVASSNVTPMLGRLGAADGPTPVTPQIPWMWIAGGAAVLVGGYLVYRHHKRSPRALRAR